MIIMMTDDGDGVFDEDDERDGIDGERDDVHLEWLHLQGWALPCRSQLCRIVASFLLELSLNVKPCIAGIEINEESHERMQPNLRAMCSIFQS